MNKQQPTFPSPTICPFLHAPKTYPHSCNVSTINVADDTEKSLCRGDFSTCANYSEQVYKDLMASIREGIREVAEKDPESLLRIFAPKK